VIYTPYDIYNLGYEYWNDDNWNNVQRVDELDGDYDPSLYTNAWVFSA